MSSSLFILNPARACSAIRPYPSIPPSVHPSIHPSMFHEYITHVVDVHVHVQIVIHVIMYRYVCLCKPRTQRAQRYRSCNSSTCCWPQRSSWVIEFPGHKITISEAFRLCAFRAPMPAWTIRNKIIRTCAFFLKHSLRAVECYTHLISLDPLTEQHESDNERSSSLRMRKI